jgi:hypothetical protein
VVFGYRWTGGQSVDLNQSAEHEKLIALVVSYGVHAITLELAARLKTSSTVDEYKTRDGQFKEWLKNHPQDYPLLHHLADDIKDPEAVAMPIAKQFVDDQPPLIHNLLVNLTNRVFVFPPTSDTTAAGWRSFFEFADGYSRLPVSVINDLGNYLFEARIPSQARD